MAFPYFPFSILQITYGCKVNLCCETTQRKYLSWVFWGFFASLMLIQNNSTVCFFLCAKDFPHKLFKKNGYILRLSQTQQDAQYDRCGHLSLHRDNSATSAQKGVSRWKCQKCMVFLCLNANQRYLQTDINEMDVKTVLPPDS